MKIKLVRYPYKDYEVGEIVDLGEEKNTSMVSIGRAVWVEEAEVKKKPARGPDGKFISKKETEEPKKKDS